MSETKGTYTTKPTPTLTALDLAVILDTLDQSIRIKDDGTIFHFTDDARADVMVQVAALMRSLNVTITLEAEDDQAV